MHLKHLSLYLKKKIPKANKKNHDVLNFSKTKKFQKKVKLSKFYPTRRGVDNKFMFKL